MVTDGDLTQVLSDINTFTTNHSLPAVATSVVTIGSTSNDTANAAEWALDSQSVVGMAGGQVGHLFFYNPPNLNEGAPSAAYNQAVSDNLAKVIVIATGECET